MVPIIIYVTRRLLFIELKNFLSIFIKLNPMKIELRRIGKPHNRKSSLRFHHGAHVILFQTLQGRIEGVR